ncbi:hypothetical protein Nepgr_025224 [Nepenthes gracilis]|uniref:CASP-like protein n=1 Tax=Nepenthes gracilis TaxID=150966 RepID=A0AAD3T6A2_NEPGR|nr:hypothetical protein Nepgr_025224 [Nepenthes gracilis]
MQEPRNSDGKPPSPTLSPPPAPSTPPAASPPISSSSKTQLPTQMDNPHPSPLRSDEPEKPSSPSNKGGAIVAFEKYYSPLTSPLPVTAPKNASAADNFPHPNLHVITFNRETRRDMTPSALVATDASGGEGDRVAGGRERQRKGVRLGVVEEIVGKSKREEMLKRVALGLRLSELVLCLISFSIMAADKTRGWSGDSFDRYKEYRFCLSVNVIAFVYSGFQAYDLAYHLAIGKHAFSYHLHRQFDFLMDQIMAYLLISASSAAATRLVDWQLNWGKDEFTAMISASVVMSFLAFIAFALSSLVSGYCIFNRDFA